MNQRGGPDEVQPNKPSGWRFAERLAWTAGIVALVVWIVTSLSRSADTQAALAQFKQIQTSHALTQNREPDQALWSDVRVRAWNATLLLPLPTPLAVLRISRLHLEVPVLEGTDDWTLDRAIGHITGTAAPGDEGNSGIAGHRDSFFRVLKDIRDGDAIELETRRVVETYRVERSWIVSPDDVSVLDPTATRSITLVTCYPFYFVGSAPQRYIVRAVLVPHDVRQ